MNEPKFYARKPVVIEAMRFEKPWKAVKEWCPAVTLILGQSNRVEFAQLRTRPGTIHVAIGDWIVKNEHGEFSSCSAAFFEALYEPVAGRPNRD